VETKTKKPSPEQKKPILLSLSKVLQLTALVAGVIFGILIWWGLGRLWGQNKTAGNDPNMFFVWIGLIVLTVGFIGLTPLGLMELGNLKDNKANQIVFFSGVGLITLRWVGLWISMETSYPVTDVFLLIFFLYMGLLLSSSLKYGLIENTYPPSEKVKEEVEESYRAYRPPPPIIPTSKRIFDLALAWMTLLLSFPLWIIISLLILLQDPGQVFFIKNSVGYRGKTFRLLKFRTMKKDAEEKTGPIASSNPDDRIHRLGQFLRITALDELPQMINIIRGEMSFVGPRPLRTMVEVEYLKEIPGYAARYDILPGISGLAQIAGDYYLPSRDKLRYERIYADNLSLGFDIKLIFLAFMLVLWLRWKKDWDGRVPREWIKWKGLGIR
jgi:lipopolysaccharide/colanic/teichoic acid biosynthesis glycosyltransferase